jgi:hypothetical protein
METLREYTMQETACVTRLLDSERLTESVALYRLSQKSFIGKLHANE